MLIPNIMFSLYENQFLTVKIVKYECNSLTFCYNIFEIIDFLTNEKEFQKMLFTLVKPEA